MRLRVVAMGRNVNSIGAIEVMRLMRLDWTLLEAKGFIESVMAAPEGAAFDAFWATEDDVEVFTLAMSIHGFTVTLALEP